MDTLPASADGMLSIWRLYSSVTGAFPPRPELVIRLQPGVRGIRNFIRVKPRPLPSEVKGLVEEALGHSNATP
jgi:hypothetical protein